MMVVKKRDWRFGYILISLVRVLDEYLKAKMLLIWRFVTFWKERRRIVVI